MTLADGKVGNTYYVVSTNLEKKTERRLEALGLTDGTRVELHNRKKNGTSIFNVRGTRLAVGREIAEGIRVSEENPRKGGLER